MAYNSHHSVISYMFVLLLTQHKIQQAVVYLTYLDHGSKIGARYSLFTVTVDALGM